MPGVLIVDDSPEIRSLIRTFIESTTSLQVCGEVGDGTKAIERAKELEPDVVLLDLIMPELNGVQAASILKRHLPDTKIILFSFFTEVPGKSLAAAVGVDYVLSKSDGLNGIAEAIRTVTAGIPPLDVTASRKNNAAKKIPPPADDVQ
jgi:two-component system, NarL family, vancomycin resistance associated response regulator VraR